MKKSLRIGTNGSKIALWQAEFTRNALAKIGVGSELTIFKSVDETGFHEIEQALLRGEIDLAAHSMKNLPTIQPEGLVLTAVSARENPADWLILRNESVESGPDFGVKIGATICTSTALRKEQLHHFRPDLNFTGLGENIPTQIGKLARGEFDGIVFSASDSVHFYSQLSDYQIVELSPMEFLPAPAQGILAWQTNSDDRETRLILKNLHHAEVAAMSNIERKILKLLDSNGQPVGAFCKKDAAGNYHVAAATMVNGKWQQIRLSSSTNFGLAERVVKALLIDE